MNTQKLRSLKPKEYFYNSVNRVYWHFYSIFSIFYLTSPNYMWFWSPSELKMFLSKLPIIIHMCCVALLLLHQLYLGNFAATIKFLKNLMNMFNNSELKMYIKKYRFESLTQPIHMAMSSLSIFWWQLSWLNIGLSDY